MPVLPFSELKERYPGLLLEDIYEGVELAAMRVMGQLHRCPASVVIEGEELHVTLYSDQGQKDLILKDLNKKSKLAKESKRRLIDEIELELMARQSCSEARQLGSLRGGVVTGQIEKVRPDGSLVVRIQTYETYRTFEFYGECPISQQPRHERGSYQVGQVREFMVVYVQPVSNGRHAKVRLRVSRAARELPSRILARLTGLTGIKCERRDPDGRSVLTSRFNIHRNDIEAVARELGEMVFVKWVNDPRRQPSYAIPEGHQTKRQKSSKRQHVTRGDIYITPNGSTVRRERMQA